MKLVAPLVLALALIGPTCFAAESWPLVFDTDGGWEVDYTNEKVHFFSISRPGGEHVFFIISKWPAHGNREQIPGIVRRMADGFAQKAEKDEIPLIDAEYRIEQINGEPFSGEAAVFELWDGSYQTMFMVSDGDGIWNGQFSGSPSGWAKARLFLERLKKP